MANYMPFATLYNKDVDIQRKGSELPNIGGRDSEAQLHSEGLRLLARLIARKLIRTSTPRMEQQGCKKEDKC